MTSWTVLRFFSSSSGMSTPNLSWAATAISTIDSESMSRSSTKLLSGVTSSAGTPATSSMISPRPVWISVSVIAMGYVFSFIFVFWVGPAPGLVPRAGAWSGYLDHLRGVADARAEAQQQDRVAGGNVTALDHAGQRERDRRGRGIARVHDVVGDQCLRRAELARDRLDDAQVRLVRHERGQAGRVHPGPLARGQGDRVQRGGGPPEHRLPLLVDKRAAVGNADLVGQAAVAAPDHRPDPGCGIRFGHRADHRGARAVREDNAGGPVSPVDPLGELLRPDHQHVPCAAGPHRVAGRAQRVTEAGARRVQVVGTRCQDLEPGGHAGGGVGDHDLRGAGGHDDQVDVGGGQAARGQRLPTRCHGHVHDRLVRAGQPPAGDADPAADPLVAGVDGYRKLLVGEHVRRLIPAEREDPRARGPFGQSHRWLTFLLTMSSARATPRCGPHAVSGCSLTSGWPSVTGSPSSTSHSRTTAAKSGVTAFWPRRTSMCPSGAPGGTWAPGAVSCPPPPARNVPACAATSSRQSGMCPLSWCSGTPCSASSERAASRSSGVFRATRSTCGRARRARPVSVPPGGSSISALTPRPAIVCMHWSHRTGALTWVTIRSSQSRPDLTTAPSALESSIMAGSFTVTPAAASRSAATAGAMWAVWNAPATVSGRSRPPAGGSAAMAATWAMVPAATICPAPFTLAGVSPRAASAASTSSWSPPRTAVMPVASAAAALAMARPRTLTRRIASSGVRTPAIAPAASSPTLCPAAMPACLRSWSSPPTSTSATASAAATSSGWAIAVSVISSAPAVVPQAIRSHPARSDQAVRRSATPGRSSHGARKPGACAP